MAGTTKSVAIRLGTEGKAQVQNDFADTKAAGVGAMTAVGDAAVQQGERIATATEQASARQQAAWEKQAAAARVAMTRSDARSSIDESLSSQGIGRQQFATVNFDRQSGAAREAAASFQQMFDAEDQAAAGARKLADALSAARAEMAAEVAQGGIDGALGARGNARQFATVNFDRSSGAARDSAASFEAVFAAEERAAAAADRLRATIDPLYLAQKRYNDELRVWKLALEQGDATQEEHDAALAVSAKRMRDAEDAAKGLGNAHQGASVQTMMLQSAIFRAGESVSSGMPIMRIAAQQGMEVAEAFTMGSTAISGGMSIAITGLIALLGILGPKLFDSASASDLLAAHQKSLGDIMDETTGRIKEQNSALVIHQSLLTADDAKNAEHEVNRQKLVLLSQGNAFSNPANIGAPGMAGPAVAQDPRIAAALVAFGKDGDGGALARSMNAIGKADPKLKDRTSDIIGMAAAYVQATRSAQQLEAQQRLLTGMGRPGDQKLARGDFAADKPDLSLADAEAKLAAATTAREKAEANADITRIKGQKAVNDGTMSVQAYTAAMTKADAAVNAATTHTDRHAQTLARDAAAMNVSARAALAAADAYLQGGAAGQEAEARRQAATDATKKGIDVEAQARRQLAVSVADGALSGAKAVSSLKEETAARNDVDRQVENGTLAIGRMGQSLSDEQALRALTIKQSLAYRLGLVEDYQQITSVIAAYQQALKEAHDEEAHGQALQSLDALRNRAQDADLGRRYAGDTSGEAERARARLSANREADQRGYNDNDRSAVIAGGVQAANAELAARRAQSAADMLRSSREQIDLSQAEAALIGKSSTEHDRIIAQLQLQQTLQRDLGDGYAQWAPAILKAADAAEQDAQRVKRMQDAFAEVKNTGDQVIDDVLDPSHWGDWGDEGKRILQELEQEMLKLALINPLKNMLFGGNNATLGSVFSLFGGGGALGAGVSASNASLTASLTASNQGWFNAMHFASGSLDTPGGLAWVGEHGRELVNMPSGSRVYNAADTSRMMSAANDQGGTTNHYYLSGNLLTPDFWQQINAGQDSSAARGAAGGAQLAQRNAQRAAKRKLGTRNG